MEESLEDKMKMDCYRKAMEKVTREDLYDLALFQHLLLSQVSETFPGLIGLICATDSVFVDVITKGGDIQRDIVDESKRLFDLKVNGN